MARDYGKIETGFWDNPKVRRLSEDGRSILQYVFTAPSSTAAGTFILPMSHMTDALQWSEDRVLTALQEISRKPFAIWDRDTRLMHVPGWWGHNDIVNPNVASHVAKLLITLPDCALKALAIKGLRAFGKYPQAVEKVIGDWRWDDSQETLPLLMAPQRRALPTKSPIILTADPVPSPKSDTRAKRLDDDWSPTVDDVAYAKGKGLGEPQIEAEATKFVRYWTGPDASNQAKKDWHRTWCNWVDKAAERKPTNGHANGHSSGAPNGGIELHDNGEITILGVRKRQYSTGMDDAAWPQRVAMYQRSKVWKSDWGPEPGRPHCRVPPELLTPSPE